MSGPDLAAASPVAATNLVRYSVTPTDVQLVRQQLKAVDQCDDQMIRQFVQATGGDLTSVSAKYILEYPLMVHQQAANCS